MCVCVSVCARTAGNSSRVRLCIIFFLKIPFSRAEQHLTCACKCTAHTDTHSHCRVSHLALMVCPGRDRDRREGARRNWWIVSQHSAFASAPGLPFSPSLKILKVGQSTLHWSVLAGLSHQIPNGGEVGSHKNTEGKGKGPGGEGGAEQLTAHCEVEEKICSC